MRKLSWGCVVVAAFLFSGSSVSANESCVWDFNGDGLKDEADAAILHAALGTAEGEEGYNPVVDMDGSGTITTADYGIFLSCN